MLIDTVEFAENPEPRCPCVLLLDTSASMKGAPLQALREGLEAFRFDLTVDPLAARRVEVAIVTFDDRVQLMQDFTTPDRLQVPPLVASGQTHMSQAVLTGLQLVEARKSAYRTNDIAYYRPWVFLVTDGEPMGEPMGAFERAAADVRLAEDEKRAAVFAVGVENANLATLSRLVVRQPMKLKGLDFRTMFVWLSRSMHAVARSRPDDRISLAPAGWAEL